MDKSNKRVSKNNAKQSGQMSLVEIFKMGEDLEKKLREVQEATDRLMASEVNILTLGGIYNAE